MKKSVEFCYGIITPVSENWFIVQMFEVGKLKNHRYILVGRDELIKILVEGINVFLRETGIEVYTSKKAIARRYSKEPAYAYLFTSSKWFI